MNEKTAILNVRMLGDFSITYDGRQVSFGKNTTTKAMKLLQILIYYGEQGIAREKLLNALYVREELADAANNLRVTAHRLKKMIIDAGLPEYDYIVIKKGVYRWNAPVPTIVDARKFQELYEEAQNCADTKQKEELLNHHCDMCPADRTEDYGISALYCCQRQYGTGGSHRKPGIYQICGTGRH